MRETLCFTTVYYQDNPATLLFWLGINVLMNVARGRVGNCVVCSEY